MLTTTYFPPQFLGGHMGCFIEIIFKFVNIITIVTKCGFVSRNILGRRCKPLEARAAGNVAA